MTDDITPRDIGALAPPMHVSDRNLTLLRYNQEHGWFQKVAQGVIETCHGYEVILDPRSIKLGYLTSVQEGGRRKNVYKMAGLKDKPINKDDLDTIPNSNGWSPEAQIRGAFTDYLNGRTTEPDHFLVSASTRSYIDAIYEVVDMVKDDVKANQTIRFPVMSLETRPHDDKPIRVPHFTLLRWSDNYPD